MSGWCYHSVQYYSQNKYNREISFLKLAKLRQKPANYYYVWINDVEDRLWNTNWSFISVLLVLRNIQTAHSKAKEPWKARGNKVLPTLALIIESNWKFQDDQDVSDQT